MPSAVPWRNRKASRRLLFPEALAPTSSVGGASSISASAKLLKLVSRILFSIARSLEPYPSRVRLEPCGKRATAPRRRLGAPPPTWHHRAPSRAPQAAAVFDVAPALAGPLGAGPGSTFTLRFPDVAGSPLAGPGRAPRPPPRLPAGAPSWPPPAGLRGAAAAPSLRSVAAASEGGGGNGFAPASGAAGDALPERTAGDHAVERFRPERFET
jgi:hypothetical protein